jgi:hypothetical protein
LITESIIEKSLTSTKGILVRVNSTRIHPKWQANAWIVIRNVKKKVQLYFVKNMARIEHLRVKAHLPLTFGNLLLYTINVQNGKRMRIGRLCQWPQEKGIFEINFDYFWLISQKCASNYSDDWLPFFVWLPITSTCINNYKFLLINLPTRSRFSFCSELSSQYNFCSLFKVENFWYLLTINNYMYTDIRQKKKKMFVSCNMPKKFWVGRSGFQILKFVSRQFCKYCKKRRSGWL